MAFVHGISPIYNLYQDLYLIENQHEIKEELINPIKDNELLNPRFSFLQPILGNKSIKNDSNEQITEENVEMPKEMEVNTNRLEKDEHNDNLEKVSNDFENLELDTKLNKPFDLKDDLKTFIKEDINSETQSKGLEEIQSNLKQIKDHSILGLFISPNRDFLATLSYTTVEIWLNKPTLLVAQMVRSNDSIETQGTNVDLRWRSDSSAFSIFTTQGYIYFYTFQQHYKRNINLNLNINSNSQPNTNNFKQLINENENSIEIYQHNLTLGLSAQLNQLHSNNPSNCFLQNPSKFFELKIQLIIFVEAGISCFEIADDTILVATERNASVASYSWKDKVLLSSLHLAFDAPFLIDKNVIVQQMVYDSNLKIFAWLTSDGSIYLTKRKLKLNVFGTGSPYEWTGLLCHSGPNLKETIEIIDNDEDNNNNNNSSIVATQIALNPRFYLIAALMKTNQILFYYYGKHGNQVKLVYQIQIGSSVQCISWSNDGQKLSVGTLTKGLILFTIYSKVPNFITTNGQMGFQLRDNKSINYDKDSNNDAFIECVHNMTWNTNDNELILTSNISEYSKGKIYVLSFDQLASSCLHTDANMKHPTLFSSNHIIVDFFIQTEQGSINPDASVHISQIPSIYSLDNYPIKYCSRSMDGNYIALAGQRGLAYYSVTSRRWKWFNSQAQEQQIMCIGGLVWWKSSLLVACRTLDKSNYKVLSFPKDKNLDIYHVTCTLELPTKPQLVNVVGHFLVVYTLDNLLNFFEIVGDVHGRIIQLVPVHKISLDGVVKSPSTVQAISWFPGNLRDQLPKILLLSAGSLLLFNPEISDNHSNQQQQPKYRISLIADKVIQFQLLDTPLAGVHFTLWCYSHGEFKLFYHLPEVPYFDDTNKLESLEDDASTLHQENINPFQFNISFQIPFHPVTLDIQQGLLFGIEQSLFEGQTMPGMQFAPSYKSQVIFYNLLEDLIKRNLDQEAYLFALHYESCPYFEFGLEILLHDTLVRETEAKFGDDDETLNPQDILPRTVNLLRQFPSFPKVVVSCARKIEVALWHQLFKAVGAPVRLFELCLSANQLDTAASYLIILHTLDDAPSAFSAASKLLRQIIEHRDLPRFHQVAKFLARIHGCHNRSFLARYLDGLDWVLTEEKQNEELMLSNGFEIHNVSIESENQVNNDLNSND